MLFFPEAVFKGPLFILTLAAALLLGAASGSAEASEVPRTGVVTVDRLNLRPTPGFKGTPIASLPKGSQVDILGRERGWLKVRQGEKTGFILDNPRFVHQLKASEKASPPGPETPEQRIERLKKEALDLQRSIEARKAGLDEMAGREKDTLDRIDAIEGSIRSAAGQIASHRREIAALERRMAEARKRYAELQRQREADETYAGKRLVALYKLHAVGAGSFFGPGESLQEMGRVQKALSIILRQDEAVLQRLEADRVELAELLSELERQQAAKLDLMNRLQAQKDRMAEERRSKAVLLESVREEKDFEIAAIRALERAAQALERTLGGLAREAEGTAPPPGGVRIRFLKRLAKRPGEG